MENKEFSSNFAKIRSIRDLNLPKDTRSLNVANNRIQNMEGIKPLKELRYLNLSGNKI